VQYTGTFMYQHACDIAFCWISQFRHCPRLLRRGILSLGALTLQLCSSTLLSTSVLEHTLFDGYATLSGAGVASGKHTRVGGFVCMHRSAHLYVCMRGVAGLHGCTG
jgi:hypothetical protein